MNDIVLGPLRFEELPQKGVFLWLLKVDRIPPHLGLSVDGSYYSITIKGSEIALNLESEEQKWSKRGLPRIAIELAIEAPSFELLEQVFEASTLRSAAKSCLIPVLHLLSFSIPEIGRYKTVHELINRLQSLELIKAYFGSNVKPWLTDGMFHLKHYTSDDVQAYIHTLKLT